MNDHESYHHLRLLHEQGAISTDTLKKAEPPSPIEKWRRARNVRRKAGIVFAVAAVIGLYFAVQYFLGL